MSGKDKILNPGETRKFLDEAIKEFRTTVDPDNRLRSLWKISQLVEDITDEELYELASSTVVEEDPRLRGEICYTISRSHRPQLIKILKMMIWDKNPYVRRSAITALGILGGSKATLAAIEPILDEIDGLREIVAELEEKVLQLRDTNEGASDTSSADSSEHEIVMDDYMKCWETYLRHEKELIRNHRGKYVAVYKGKIVGVDEDEASLAETIYQKYGSVEALICRIQEEEEPIQMPPPREIIG